MKITQYEEIFFFMIYIMHAYKIYRIYLTFIAFSAMLTNHTFTDYFITVEPSILDVGFFLTGLYWSIGSTDFSLGPPFILLLHKCTRHIFVGTCEWSRHISKYIFKKCQTPREQSIKINML